MHFYPQQGVCFKANYVILFPSGDKALLPQFMPRIHVRGMMMSRYPNSIFSLPLVGLEFLLAISGPSPFLDHMVSMIFDLLIFTVELWQANPSALLISQSLPLCGRGELAFWMDGMNFFRRLDIDVLAYKRRTAQGTCECPYFSLGRPGESLVFW